jgi:hypothetical protein
MDVEHDLSNEDFSLISRQFSEILAHGYILYPKQRLFKDWNTTKHHILFWYPIRIPDEIQCTNCFWTTP